MAGSRWSKRCQENLVAVEIGTKKINNLTDVDDESVILMMMMAALTQVLTKVKMRELVC